MKGRQLSYAIGFVSAFGNGKAHLAILDGYDCATKTSQANPSRACQDNINATSLRKVNTNLVTENVSELRRHITCAHCLKHLDSLEAK